MNNARAILNEVTKYLPNDNIFELSIHMINYYFTKYYQGQEHDEIIKQYATRVWLDLSEWLFQNYYVIHISTKKKYRKTFNFSKSIKKAQNETYLIRSKYLNDWKQKKKTKLKIVNLLINLYPDIKDEQKVKKELGLC